MSADLRARMCVCACACVCTHACTLKGLEKVKSETWGQHPPP